MPIKRIQFPDGSIKRVEVPEGATDEQILAFVQSQAKPKESYESLQARALEKYGRSDPTEGMSGGERFMAGVGKSIYDTGRGVKQLFGGMSREDVDAQRREDAALMDTSGGMWGNIAGTVGQILVPGGGAARLASGAGKAKTVATMVGPNGVRAAEAVRGATLPTSIRGSMVQGAAIGGVQQVGEGDSRAGNMALGAGLGGAGAAIPRGIGAVYRGTGSYIGKVSPLGVERRAARVIMGEADDPSRLLRPQPSAIPGVQRTLAEEALDPGIARLERNARSTGRGFDQTDRANNAARVAAIRQFAGDETQIAAAEAARDTAALPALREAQKVTGVDTSRLLSQIGRAEKLFEGRPSVQGTLREVKGLLTRKIPDDERMKAALKPLQEFVSSDRISATNREAVQQAIKQIKAGEWPSAKFISKADGATAEVGKSYDAAKAALAEARKALAKTSVGHDKLATLYNARKEIGAMMSGKLSGSNPNATAATRELMAIRNGLDRVLKKAAPEFGEYLAAYRNGSQAVNRMELGSELLQSGSGSAILDPVTGQPVLTAAAFGRQAQNLDRTAARATGFRKAKADDILQPQDRATIDAVQDDLNRRAFAATAGSGGNSQTFERMALNDRMAGGFAARLPIIGRAMEYLGEIGQTRLQATIANMLQNPQQARAIMQALPPADRRIVEQALSRAGGGAGALTPALTE